MARRATSFEPGDESESGELRAPFCNGRALDSQFARGTVEHSGVPRDLLGVARLDVRFCRRSGIFKGTDY